MTTLPQISKRTGRPRKHPVPSEPSAPVSSWFANSTDAEFLTLSWRTGTKGPLRAAFAVKRVRVADGPEAADGLHLPGEERWLVCEHRTTGERKFHLTSHPATATLEQLAAAIKARWSCEQAHQQLKEELGLDHYKGRSWRGLHHHALLCQVAHAFLQSLRVGEKTQQAPGQADASALPGPPPRLTLAEARRHVAAALLQHLACCHNCRHPTPWHRLL